LLRGNPTAKRLPNGTAKKLPKPLATIGKNEQLWSTIQPPPAATGDAYLTRRIELKVNNERYLQIDS
jgi:hypothetical protein